MLRPSILSQQEAVMSSSGCDVMAPVSQCRNQPDTRLANPPLRMETTQQKELSPNKDLLDTTNRRNLPRITDVSNVLPHLLHVSRCLTGHSSTFLL